MFLHGPLQWTRTVGRIATVAVEECTDLSSIPGRLRPAGGRSLDGKALAQFGKERGGIGDLLAKDNGSAEVAAVQ